MEPDRQVFTRDDKPWLRVVWHSRHRRDDGVNEGAILLQVLKSYLEPDTVEVLEAHREELQKHNHVDGSDFVLFDGDEDPDDAGWLDILLTWQECEYGFDLMSKVAALLYRDEVIQQDNHPNEPLINQGDCGDGDRIA